MTTKEKIAVMQACVDGKQIQIIYYDDDKWVDWHSETDPVWNWGRCEYRIKPEEPKYRPYKDTDEMIADFCNRFKTPFLAEHEIPLIWMRSERNGSVTLVTRYSTRPEGHALVESGANVYSLEYLLENYAYLDGSPIGKLVEE